MPSSDSASLLFFTPLFLFHISSLHFSFSPLLLYPSTLLLLTPLLFTPLSGLVATGDDNSRLNLFNYPCVAKHAPRRYTTCIPYRNPKPTLTLANLPHLTLPYPSCYRAYGGHSSHVMTVKFLPGSSSSSSRYHPPSSSSSPSYS